MMKTITTLLVAVLLALTATSTMASAHSVDDYYKDNECGGHFDSSCYECQGMSNGECSRWQECDYRTDFDGVNGLDRCISI